MERLVRMGSIKNSASSHYQVTNTNESQDSVDTSPARFAKEPDVKVISTQMRKSLSLRAVLRDGTYNITSWKKDGVYIGEKWVDVSNIINIKVRDISMNHVFKSKPQDYLKYTCKTLVHSMHALVNYGKWIGKIRTKIRMEPLLMESTYKTSKNAKASKDALKFVKGAGSSKRARIYSLAQALFAKIFQNTRRYMEKFVEALMRFMSPEDIKDVKLPDIYQDAMDFTDEDPLISQTMPPTNKIGKNVFKFTKLDGIADYANELDTDSDGNEDPDEFLRKVLHAPDYEHWSTLGYKCLANPNDRDRIEMEAKLHEKKVLDKMILLDRQEEIVRLKLETEKLKDARARHVYRVDELY